MSRSREFVTIRQVDRAYREIYDAALGFDPDATKRLGVLPSQDINAYIRGLHDLKWLLHRRKKSGSAEPRQKGKG